MNCPVCDLSIPSSSRHCPGCGLPIALATFNLAPFEADPASAGAETEPGPAPRGAARPTPNPDEEANAAIARALEDRMGLLRTLGGGAPDVTGAMCEAALSEASGQVANAAQILRSAERRLDEETQGILRRRLASVESRVRELEGRGLQLGVTDELARISATERAADPGEAVVYLLEVERHLGSLESTWGGLVGLLAEIFALRTEADRLGIPYGELPPRLLSLDGGRSPPELREEALDSLVQEAAQGLMVLHDALLPALELELDRHGQALHRLPTGNAPSEAVRRLHETTRRHLRDGRLSDAAKSLVDLRRALSAIESRPAVPVHRPAPTPAAAEPSPDLLPALVKKAQGLAARVRALPHDSELSRWAAEQIREATDLLRERRLAEADATLTRLMASLTAPPPRA
jgi:hypothetical protein